MVIGVLKNEFEVFGGAKKLLFRFVDKGFGLDKEAVMRLSFYLRELI